MHWNVRLQENSDGVEFVTEQKSAVKEVVPPVENENKKINKIKNGMINQGNIIPELSEEYRGSNRESFILDDIPKKLIDMQEEGMKKKTYQSEFKEMGETDEFEMGRRSSDLGIGTKN